MQELIYAFLNRGISRRSFFERLAAFGFSAAAIESLVSSVEAGEARSPDEPEAYRTFTGTGGELWVEQLDASGVRYVFCNPGSAETGFYDAFTDRPGMQIMMGLHEGIVISMADTYARLSGRAAFVNVHAMPGTAQMGGQLYNAQKSRSALVITAGMSDNTVFSDRPGLGPLPGHAQSDVTKPLTKLAWDVREPASIPLALRRAFKVASTPPGGPVYIGIATYAQTSAPVTAQIVGQEKFLVPMRPRPDAEKIERLARRLIEARQPLVVVDADLYRYDAVEEAVKLVDAIGAAVLDPRGSSGSNSGFPNQHPLHTDGKVFGGLDRAAGTNPYEPYDVIAGIGVGEIAGKRGRARPPEELSQAPGAFKAVIGLDTAEMGRTAPFDLSIVADPRAALSDLRAAVESLATRERLEKLAAERRDRLAPAIEKTRAEVRKEVESAFGAQPMHPYELVMTMDRMLEADAILVNENLSHDFTLRHAVLQHLGGDEKRRIGSGGGSLGWGIGASIGAKLAEPDRQVVLNIGDGSVMYSASGFWTMARYEVPVLVVVWNNHNYQTVRHGFARYQGKMAKTGHYTGMHLGDPDIDFPGLAKSQGVEGERVTTAAELRRALERGIAATRAGSPYLLDVDIAQIGGGAGSEWYQKFSLAATRARKV